MLFSVNPDTRHVYHELFKTHQIDKSYQAIARLTTDQDLVGKTWKVENRIVRSTPRFRMQIVDGQPNSQTMIRCLRQSADKALFELKPMTGKTHQLRLHMQSLGWPILYDKVYPTLQPETADNYSQPLRLLATDLGFIDPITTLRRAFSSETRLEFDD